MSYPKNKQDGDEFSFNRPYARIKKKAVEHNEDSVTASTSIDVQRFPSYRKFTVSSKTREKYAQDLNHGSNGILSPVHHINYCRKIAKYLGQVVYGERELVKAFARYWQEHKSEKLVDGIKSEGILLNRSLTISPAHSYTYSSDYLRISSNATNNDSTLNSIPDVGMGRFGRVYRAVDCSNGMENEHVEFAEKIIAFKKFNENELNILSSIEHNHIIHLLGAVKSIDAIHVFMNYAPGGNIDELICNGFLNTDSSLYKEYWATNYFKQIMSALQYLHSLKIVHCDVKAKNVVLSSNFSHCFLADFGEALRIPKNSSFIKLESYVGTEPYMSPEMVQNNVFYPQSDVWSCACFLLNMLTSHHPWQTLYPQSNSFLYVIGNKPLDIFKEVPENLQDETKQIFHQSFTLLDNRKSSRELLILAEKSLLYLNTKLMPRNVFSEDATATPSFEATDNECLSLNTEDEEIINVRQASGDITATPSPTKVVQIDYACNNEDDDINSVLDLLMEIHPEESDQDSNQVESELEAILSDPEKFLSDSCSNLYNGYEMNTKEDLEFEMERNSVLVKRYPSEKIVHRSESLILDFNDHEENRFSDANSREILVHMICSGMDTIDFFSKSTTLGYLLIDAKNIVYSKWKMREYCVTSNNIWQDYNSVINSSNEINIYVTNYTDSQHSDVNWHISDGELICDNS